MGESLTAEKMNQCRWVGPELVCQIAFVEWTDAWHLRHCTFVAMRDDKKPAEVGFAKREPPCREVTSEGCVCRALLAELRPSRTTQIEVLGVPGELAFCEPTNRHNPRSEATEGAMSAQRPVALNWGQRLKRFRSTFRSGTSAPGLTSACAMTYRRRSVPFCQESLRIDPLSVV